MASKRTKAKKIPRHTSAKTSRSVAAKRRPTEGEASKSRSGTRSQRARPREALGDGAHWHAVEISHGVSRLFCPACAQIVLEPDLPAPDRFCKHVLFVEDWIDGFAYIREDLEPVFEKFHSRALSRDALKKRVLGSLPATGLVLDFVEPGRGAGHDGGPLAVGFDLAGAGALAVLEEREEKGEPVRAGR